MLIILGHVGVVVYFIIRMYIIRGYKEEETNNEYYTVTKRKLYTHMGLIYMIMLVVTFVITLLLF